jgi:hypothetical protein
LRERTAFPVVLYALYPVFLGLGFRAVSYGVMWLCGSGFRKLYTYRCRVSLFLVDETAVMVGGFPAWVWMTYEPFSRRIMAFMNWEQPTSGEIPKNPGQTIW